ncbi:hypothetical protein SAMN02745166_03086 [Prosthecobacter debontii]|uniref:Uncharacterized protein n=1 Tax=Prosthecobacter debontii TaxID=48467 RepID=A0A1T4YF48_9BACT|nr:hypothetical protein [Prosthecobacter debontii]SKB00178.1 hypothetical protein SAMN02745166_03086 [Prosthecobacter debontii]
MDRIWRVAFAVAGLAAVAFFTFLSLYRQWLALDIFSRLDKDQTFIVMLTFLGLTFLALIVGVGAWLKSSAAPSDEQALHRLEQAWTGVNYIDCDNLIGPAVEKAGNALQMTAMYWRKRFLSKDVIHEQYGSVYIELFEQLDGCDKNVPGYTKPVKTCKQFLSALVRAVYLEIKAYAARQPTKS